MKIYEIAQNENLSHTGTATARAARRKGIEPGTEEWFEHWFSLPYMIPKKKKVQENADIISEGPLGKAVGAAALAGTMGAAGYGAAHLASLNDITAQQPQRVAQAPAQAKQDLKTVQAKAQKSAAEPDSNPQKSAEYTPITGKKNETILARVAMANGITGVELAAFMAQMAHESWNFGDMVENNPNVERYAKLKSLGNKNMNDAERFIGRGFIQLTGRWNYEHYGKKIGMDLTSTWSAAHQAADPKIAAKIAVAFWKSRVQPNVQDFTDVAQVTKPINPGLNGLEDRERKFSKISAHMGIDT